MATPCFTQTGRYDRRNLRLLDVALASGASRRAGAFDSVDNAGNEGVSMTAQDGPYGGVITERTRKAKDCVMVWKDVPRKA